jgi:hypothetical protein
MHCSSDFQFGAWFFAVISFCVVPYFIYDIAKDPSDVIPYLWVICMGGFGVGSCLFVYTSYPENMFPPTTWFWVKCLACCCAVGDNVEGGAAESGDALGKPAEETPLMGDGGGEEEEDPKKI